MGTVHRKFTAYIKAWRLYLQHPDGLSDAELAAHLDVSIATANRYRNELGAKIVTHGKYTVEPTADQITLAKTIINRSEQK